MSEEEMSREIRTEEEMSEEVRTEEEMRTAMEEYADMYSGHVLKCFLRRMDLKRFQRYQKKNTMSLLIV